MSKDNEKIIIETDDVEFLGELEAKKRKNMRLLSFVLNDENYSVEINQIKEVLDFYKVTRVPNTPEFIVGVVNLRGEIISLIDIKYFLGLTQSGELHQTKIIVTDVSGALVGLLVDDVRATIDIEENSIQPPLSTVKSSITQYTKGQIQVDEEIYVLLDLKKILDADQIKDLKKE